MLAHFIPCAFIVLIAALHVFALANVIHPVSKDRQCPSI